MPLFSARFAALGARFAPLGAAFLLSGCYIDTSSMNTDRFVQQTRPIFYEDEQPVEQLPDSASAYVAPPNALPRVPLQQPSAGLPSRTPPSSNYPAAPKPVVKAGLTLSPGQLDVYDPEYDSMYGAFQDKDRLVPALPYKRIPAKFLRREVAFPTADRPGTIIVDTKEKFLYLVLGNGRAMRYGVGLGRKGFAWHGRGVIQWRQRWPRWTPPDEMVQRQPEIAQYSAANGGMNPGLNNPLGARALYIFQNGQDSLFRIHGTPEWRSIGKSVSSGCVRMLNQDVIDLYDRLPEKADIVVM